MENTEQQAEVDTETPHTEEAESEEAASAAEAESEESAAEQEPAQPSREEILESEVKKLRARQNDEDRRRRLHELKAPAEFGFNLEDSRISEEVRAELKSDPTLAKTLQETVRYMVEEQLKYIQDSSNYQQTYAKKQEELLNEAWQEYCDINGVNPEMVQDQNLQKWLAENESVVSAIRTADGPTVTFIDKVFSLYRKESSGSVREGILQKQAKAQEKVQNMMDSQSPPSTKVKPAKPSEAERKARFAALIDS